VIVTLEDNFSFSTALHYRVHSRQYEMISYISRVENWVGFVKRVENLALTDLEHSEESKVIAKASNKKRNMCHAITQTYKKKS
jgi:hypothetical protein